MTTLRDVARHVGVSITQVSRALNNYDDVSKETRQRIRDAALELDYHPSAVARNLQGSKTNTIGLVMPLVLHRSYDTFWLEFVSGMTNACTKRGMDLLVATADTHEAPAQVLRRLVRGRRVDGILVCDIREGDQRIAYLQKEGAPFVAFGRTTNGQDYPYIDVDGTAGVMQALNYLLSFGHRRIAYLGLDRAFGFSRFRFDGYQQALLHAGVPLDPTLIFHDLTEATVKVAIADLLTRLNRPTAVFAAADFLALSVLKVAHTAGLNLPGDLSVAVFDDNVLVQQATPPLTAVSQPNRRLGEDAAIMLIDRIASPDGPLTQCLVTPSFIVRESTAVPLS